MFRIEENFNVFDFELIVDDMVEINGLNSNCCKGLYLSDMNVW